MGSDVTSAVAGLIGAAFGAGAAMWGSVTTARTQLRLSQAQTRAAIVAEETKVTRAVYADFLRAGVEYELAWRRLLISLREGVSTSEERDQLYAQVIGHEHDRWTSYSILLLEAPDRVTSLARELTNAYVELDTIAERTRRRLSAQGWQDFNEAAERCGVLTASFAEGTKAVREDVNSLSTVHLFRRAGISRRAKRSAAVDATRSRGTH
ncbi:hypothetical protein ABH926_002153 [Catenulispora sp. GP43]|uniref:hypothetical protein n=1 Tax=Catenulispora sp. GP43 TaxID=3156263 RepID=UPI0035125F9B